MSSTSLFSVVWKETKPFRKIKNASQLQKAAKLKRKNPDQEEFYIHCKTICKKIKDEHSFSIEEIQKLKRSLMYKRKNCSKAWTEIDTLIKFGGEWAEKRYGPTKDLLIKDKHTYIIMGILVSELEKLE